MSRIINFVFYFFYKPNTQYFKDGLTPVIFGVAGTLMTFMFSCFLLFMLLLKMTDSKIHEYWFLTYIFLINLLVLFQLLNKKNFIRIIEKIKNENAQQKRTRYLALGILAGINFILFYVVFALSDN